MDTIKFGNFHGGKMQDRQIGTIKWTKLSKGFCFIKSDNGEDYFAHVSSFPEREFLDLGTKVTFRPFDSLKGLQALDIEPLI